MHYLVYAMTYVAKNEEADNLSGIIAKKYPWLDSALATKDTDHPALNKLRHIVEGMGIGAVFDATIFKITPLAEILAGEVVDAGRPIAGNIADTGIKAGKEIKGDAAKRVYDARGELKAAAGEDIAAIRSKFEEFRKSRLDSVETQKREQAKSQMKDSGFRAPKNEPIADPWQGATTSNSTAEAVDKSETYEKRMGCRRR